MGNGLIARSVSTASTGTRAAYQFQSTTEQGIVSVLNERSGLFAIELADGTFVLAELLGNGQLRLGEQVRGEMRSFGEATLERVAGGDAVTAFVRAYEISREAAEFEIF